MGNYFKAKIRYDSCSYPSIIVEILLLRRSQENLKMLLSYQQKFAFPHSTFLPVERHTFPRLAGGKYGGAFPPVHAGRAVPVLEPAVPGFNGLPFNQFVG
jgi:hypothetical protein